MGAAEGEKVVAVGIPSDVEHGLVGWFGSALIAR
jgi:hypothetical protein